MKLLTSALPLAVLVTADAVGATPPRSTCEDASTPVPTTQAPTPVPTTETPTPAPTTTPWEFALLDDAANLQFYRITAVLDRCQSWDGCIINGPFTTAAWNATMPPGTTIQFYPTHQCDGDEFVERAAEGSGSFASPDLAEYHTYVFRSAPDSVLDLYYAPGCQK